MKIPKSFKGVPIVVLICILISSILIAYAVTSWQQSITWSMGSFEVYENEGLSVPMPTELGLGDASQSEGETIVYWIENTGDVAIIVEVITDSSGVTADWVATSLPLGIGQSGTFTLVLTNFVSGGYCNLEFALA